MSRSKATATAVAFVALLAIVGAGAFALTRGDEPAATPPSTTATSAPPTRADVAGALARAFSAKLATPLSADQAHCIADAFLEIVGDQEARHLATTATPLAGVTVAQRGELVRGIVDCVPADVAAALFGAASSTTVVPALPGD